MSNYIHTYLSEIPTEFPQAAFYSAYYSFALSSIIERSFRAGLYSALFAATASAIGSVVFPLLKSQYADQKGHLSWKAMMVSQITGLALMQLILRSTGAIQTHFFASAFFTLLAVDLSCSHDVFNAKKNGPVFIFI